MVVFGGVWWHFVALGGVWWRLVALVSQLCDRQCDASIKTMVGDGGW